MLKKVLGANWEPLCLRAGLLLCLALVALLLCFSACINGELFTNYVYKRRVVGGQKNRVFVNFYTKENVNGGG